ncbi:MAG: hypothetical protein GXP15_13900 [Gammaproteobacteria bacterium]|nr:hypothetical protein [Gammaproteobacteria bacterium]
MSDRGIVKRVVGIAGIGLVTVLSSFANAAITTAVSASINGSDGMSINGSDRMSINGSDRMSINGSDRMSINGSDRMSINGSDRMSINGSDQMSINGSDLLARGQIDYIGDDFISVMGQTVFDSSAGFDGLTAGMTVAIYGAIDRGTGGFIDTQIMKLAPAGVDSGLPDYLRGIVDSVDAKFGVAVIGGMTVDYTAMLSSSGTPQIGDEIAIQGRNYRDLGRLVASP